jgi:Ni/Fe-hydrogenase subunit HybB-like protein
MNRQSHASIALAVGVVIVAILVAVGVGVFFALPDWPSRGQFGDVFGAANALFSGLAFTGLIYTVFLQREELALQRKELELTRQELQRTAKAQEQSEVALRSQAAAASLSARMSSASALLDHYRSELRPFRSAAIPSDDPRRGVIRDLESKEQALLQILDRMYEKLTAQGDQREQL